MVLVSDIRKWCLFKEICKKNMMFYYNSAFQSWLWWYRNIFKINKGNRWTKFKQATWIWILFELNLIVNALQWGCVLWVRLWGGVWVGRGGCGGECLCTHQSSLTPLHRLTPPTRVFMQAHVPAPQSIFPLSFCNWSWSSRATIKLRSFTWKPLGDLLISPEQINVPGARSADELTKTNQLYW